MKETANAAYDFLEDVLTEDYANYSKTHDVDISVEEMRGFYHVICGLLKVAFARGFDGKNAPVAIEELRRANIPVMSIVANAVESAYNEGCKRTASRIS